MLIAATKIATTHNPNIISVASYRMRTLTFVYVREGVSSVAGVESDIVLWPVRQLRGVCVSKRELDMRSRTMMMIESGSRMNTGGMRRKTARRPLGLAIERLIP